jgi:dolichyl-phosphate beta-glucosyltransferase
VLAGYLTLALVVLANVWRHLPNGRLRVGGIDQYAFEWFFWNGPHSVVHADNPLFTRLWNPPSGANLMANTSMLGVGLPLAPLTLLAGSRVTFAVVATLGLAGSAAAWYWLFRRLVPGSIVGAAIGGGFCGFAPPMISHENGAHLNLVTTCVLPFIIANVLRLCQPGRALRNGVPLGLLTAYQIFVGEEIAVLAAIGFTLFCLAYLASRPREALAAVPHLARGLAVAAAIAVPLLVYPIWWQFAGPQSYSGLPVGAKTTNDVLSIAILPSQSLLGDLRSTAHYSASPEEQNGFFGVPLLLLVAFGVWRLRRQLLARLSAIVIVLACLLSFGSVIRLRGHRLVPGPWALLQHVPLLDTIILGRLAFIAVPFIGLILAMLVADLTREVRRRRSPETLRVLRFGALAIAAALLPIAPTPLPVTTRPAIPEFITTGAWRQSISPGSTLLTVPLTMSNGGLDTMNWQIPADGGFALAGGYFLGPHGNDRTGHYFPENTATQRMLNDVWLTGRKPRVGDKERAQARADLARLRVDAVVVQARRGHATEAVEVLTGLLGTPPVEILDVSVWRIHDGTAVQTVN